MEVLAAILACVIAGIAWIFGRRSVDRMTGELSDHTERHRQRVKRIARVSHENQHAAEDNARQVAEEARRDLDSATLIDMLEEVTEEWPPRS